MIYPETKKEDIEFRNGLLYLMESSLRAYNKTGDPQEYELFKQFSKTYKQIEQRIQQDSYEEQERQRRRIDEKIQPLRK